MPARPQGVYQDKRGKWYFKVTVGHDPLTGKRDQITRRGFATMAEAARERREVLGKVDRGQFVPSSGRTQGRRAARPLPRRHRRR